MIFFSSSCDSHKIKTFIYKTFCRYFQEPCEVIAEKQLLGKRFLGKHMFDGVCNE